MDVLPARIRAIIRDHIVTPLHLEVLLACFRDRRDWTLTRVASTHHVSPAEAQRALQELAAAHLLLPVGDGPLQTYRFFPLDRALAEATAELNDAYEREPLLVVRAVYERASATPRRFGDGFGFPEPT